MGALAKLDTQNPVLYIEYPGLGRLKLAGTIVRCRSTRYFSLNVKSQGRMQLVGPGRHFPLTSSTARIVNPRVFN